MKVLAPYKYLGEMRQTVQGSDDKSHISDMHDVYCPIVTTLCVCDVTTLRGCAACMVLIAPVSASHASGMTSGKMSHQA